MVKKMLLLVVLVVVCLCSTSFALDPMGPPVAGLSKGQWSVGIDYSYSNVDLKGRNGEYDYMGTYAYYYDGDYYGPYYYYDSGDAPSIKLKTKMNKVFANIGYGIMDNLEVFVRLGAGDVDVKADAFDYGEESFNGDTGFAWGFGGKATLYESGDLRLGALAQMSRATSDAKLHGQNIYFDDSLYMQAWSAEAELDITEVQIAIGPAYNLAEGILVYGGPFLHYVSGDVKGKAAYQDSYNDDDEWFTWAEEIDVSYDIKERSNFGGYIGAQVEAREDISIYGEWQFTGDADAVGVGARLIF